MNIKYSIFFSRDGTVVRLPMNPETLPVAKSSENDEYNVVAIGPIMVARPPNLRTVEISSFFPGRVGPFVLTSGDFEPPEFYIDFFQKAMDDCATLIYTVVRYYEDGRRFFTSDPGFPVLVTSFSYEERGGETGDFYYTLNLTEYRDWTPQQVQIAQPSSTQTAASTEQPAQARIENTRQIPAGTLAVGTRCIINGQYYCSSYGDEPHGNGNGRQCLVSRILKNDPPRAYPIHVTTESGGALGWCKEENLQVVQNGG